MKAILEENTSAVLLTPQVSLRMGRTEEKKRVDLTSITLTTRPIELVDSHNYTPTSRWQNYLVLTEACEKESYNTLTKKVDKIVPNPFDPKYGLEEDANRTVDVVTSSGTNEFTFGIVRNNGRLCLTGAVGDVSICVPLPRTLLKRNKAYKEQADMVRAIYMLLFRCLNIEFVRTTEKESGFIKLIKSLYGTERKN